MRYLHSLHYIHYHTQLAIPTVYDDSLSYYEVMNKTYLHFNAMIDEMNKNYEIIDQAFQEVLKKTNEWMEEAKAQADRAEQEANNSQASAEASQQAAEDARNQANRASTEADRANQEATNAANSAASALEQANRAESEANRAQTEAGNAAASATEAQKQAEASANSASQSAASASEAKNQADRAQTEATNAANSAADAKTQADRAQSEAEKSAASAGESAQSATDAKTQADAAANSATQAAQSATDAANSAKEAADTLDTAKETFVKRAGDTMSGNLTISSGGLNVTGGLSTDEITDSGKLTVNGLIDGNKGLEITIGSEGGISFQNVSEGVKLSVPLRFTNPNTISNLASPGSEDQAANKQYVDNINTGVQAQIKDLKDNYLPKNGGTMSGVIDMGNNAISNLKDPTANTDAVNKRSVDKAVETVNNSIAQTNAKVTEVEGKVTANTQNITNLTTKVDSNTQNITEINNKITQIEGDITTVEGNYLPLTGGTLTGNLTMGTNQIVLDQGHIAAGNNTLLMEGYPEVDVDGAKISMVASPTDLMDAANKEYVDNAVETVNNSIAQTNAKVTEVEGKVTANTQNITNLTTKVDSNTQNITEINNKITQIEGDITTVEGNYLPLTGGTLTGNLTMGTNQIVLDQGHIAAGNNTLLMEGYPEVDVDGAKISMVASPTDLMDAANKEYVDNAVAGVKPTGDYLPLAGGTMSGDIDMGVNNSVRFGAANYALYQHEGTGHLVLTGNSNTDIVEMNNIGTLQFGNKTTIKNVKSPTNNGDATPKSYVDGQIAIAKNDVKEQMQGYLPLTGGRLSGNLLMGTGTQIDFEEGAHLAYATDFGFGVQTNGGSVGIVSNNIVHTDTPIALNSKLITYSISDVSVVPGTTVKQYNCDGTGFQQMNYTGFQSVGFEHDIVVKEDIMFSPEMNRPSRIIFNEDKGGMIEHLNTPVNDTDAANKAYVDSKINTSLVYNVNNLVFHITHIGNDLYKCDCYTDIPFDVNIHIISQGIKAQNSFSHTLTDFILEKGFTFVGGNESFIQTVTLSSGISAIISARLFDNDLVIYATIPERTISSLYVGLTLPVSFLCTSLLSKR